MKLQIFTFLFVILLGSASVQAIKNEPLFNAKQEEPKIYINNRILTRVNGKPISTYDLMKKMDLLFYRQYPQYTSQVVARAQYYEMSWKYVLEEIIDKELILADAKESKIEVSNGDIRQEMETSFGPNIIANLDKAGISFDEATKMMQDEIIIRRMISGRVHAKALRQVTPIKVRRAYQEFIQDPANHRLTQWNYRVITIKERTLQKTEETAQEAYRLILAGVPLDQLSEKLKEGNLLGRKGKVTVSNSIQQHDQELSKEYAKILGPLDPGMFSQPFAIKSRANNATVYRILVLQEKSPGGVPTFKEMEPILKDKLLNAAVDQETEIYLKKLRLHYHIGEDNVDEHLPADYQPFVLKNAHL